MLIFPHFIAWTAREKRKMQMTKLSDIRDNLKNSPPRLLKVIDQLLKWCDPALRDHSLCASKGRDPILLRWELMERGLYPYKPGSRPVDILGDGITPRGPYRELGFVVDDYLVGMLTGDVYDNILRLIEREGALFLPARRDEESVRDFLLRMRAWCLRVRPDHSERLPPLSKAGALPVNEGQMSGEARAVGVLAQHPDWTDKQVARAAGVHPKSLYRYQRFKIARGALKDSGQSDLPRGFKTDDGDIEAYE